jgi:glycine hydroxymethyltransferase
MHVIAGKAICFAEAASDDFKVYGQAIIDNARALAETLRDGGLTLISGGTDNHLMLVDVTALGSTGKLAESVLEKCGITVNMNMIPYDERKPLDPSGIRIGTPALTSRGMGTDEMKQIGHWMLKALRAPEDEELLKGIRSEVSTLCTQFPVPAAALEAV